MLKLTFTVWVAPKTEMRPVKLNIGCHGNRAEVLLLWTWRIEDGGVCVSAWVGEVKEMCLEHFSCIVTRSVIN